MANHHNLLSTTKLVVIAQLVKHWAGDQEIASSWFDSWISNVLLCLVKALYAYFALGPSILPVVVYQLD